MLEVLSKQFANFWFSYCSIHWNCIVYFKKNECLIWPTFSCNKGHLSSFLSFLHMTNFYDIATHLKLFFSQKNGRPSFYFLLLFLFQQKKKTFLSVRDKFLSHIKCVSFSSFDICKIYVFRHIATLCVTS